MTKLKRHPDDFKLDPWPTGIWWYYSDLYGIWEDITSGDTKRIQSAADEIRAYLDSEEAWIP